MPRRRNQTSEILFCASALPASASMESFLFLQATSSPLPLYTIVTRLMLIRVAEWLKRSVTMTEVPGSIPGAVKFYFYGKLSLLTGYFNSTATLYHCDQIDAH